MTPVEILGWVATIVGLSIGLPQVVRLLKTRDVSGLSVFGWQTIVAINVAWFGHGIRVGQANMIVANGVGLGMTLLILGLIARELGRNLAKLSVPGVLAALVMIGVDAVFGAAVFGILGIVPAVLANSAQSIELVRSPSVVGVSPLYLTLAAVNQALWLAWGIMVPEWGTIVAAAATLAVTGFNLLWWCLRMLGLRSFGKPTRTELLAVAHDETEGENPAVSLPS